MSAYIIVYRETPLRDETAIAEYSRRNYASAKDWTARFAPHAARSLRSSKWFGGRSTGRGCGAEVSDNGGCTSLV